MLAATRNLIALCACVCCFLLEVDSKTCPPAAQQPNTSSRSPKTCQDYCCQNDGSLEVSCCSDCALSLDKNDCELQNFWRYAGYAMGALAALSLLLGLGCVSARLIKSVCCRERSVAVEPTNRTQAHNGSGDAGGESGERPMSPPPPPPPPPGLSLDPDWVSRLPKKPPDYAELFTVQPPPYTESEV